MPRFYEEEEINKLHQVEISMLKDFIALCDKHNITYFGIAGTLLGAVRHQGFIPWDDDIDIAMPRKDYEKFIKVLEKEMGDKYYFLDTEHNRNYPLMTGRMCLRGTTFTEECFQKLDFDMGIFLDLYPYDNLPDNPVSFFFHKWRIWFLGKIQILRSIKKPVISQDGLKGGLILLACEIAHYLLCFLRINKMDIYNRCKKLSTRYNDRKTKRIGFPADTSPDWNTVYVKDTIPTRPLKFEGVRMQFPRKVKPMLLNLYGRTFMELPPVEKRKTHYPPVLDFGDGTGRRNK